MDLPAEVQISNDLMSIKGGKATLVAVSPHGFYEFRLNFNNRNHKVLLPIAQTAVVFRQPEAEFSAEVEIER
jgi:hypothetical protein